MPIEPGPALDRWLCERLGIEPAGVGRTCPDCLMVRDYLRCPDCGTAMQNARPIYPPISTTCGGMGVLLEALDARHNVVIHRTSGWNSVTVRVCHRHDGKRGDAGDANLPQAVALAAYAALGGTE